MFLIWLLAWKWFSIMWSSVSLFPMLNIVFILHDTFSLSFYFFVLFLLLSCSMYLVFCPLIIYVVFFSEHRDLNCFSYTIIVGEYLRRNIKGVSSTTRSIVIGLSIVYLFLEIAITPTTIRQWWKKFRIWLLGIDLEASGHNTLYQPITTHQPLRT